MKNTSCIESLHRFMMFGHFAVFLWLGIVHEARAIIANPAPFEYIQPDGSKVMIRMLGDGGFHWYEDMGGFTTVFDGKKVVYAKLSAAGELVATSLQVGEVTPGEAGLTAGWPPPRQETPLVQPTFKLHRPWLAAPKGEGQQRIAANGLVRNLVVLCRFSDHTVAAHTRPAGDYAILFNQLGGHPTLAPTGSVRDAYEENSYGLVDLQSTVPAWVTLPQNEAYYAGMNNGQPFGATPSVYPQSAQRMAEDALALVDPKVDFGQYDQDNDGYVDAITFIHSGYGSEAGGGPNTRIWSHQANLPDDWVSADNNANGVKVKVRPYHTEPALWGTAGTDITRIGVICHELGHFFGLPDLYDTDGTTPGQGLGAWCMMANSWGFDGSQLRPPHFSAWCKMVLGWVNPKTLAVAGTYSMAQAETVQDVIIVTRGFPAGEYLLIENRQAVGLDADIPQGGLAFWHIDENEGGNATQGFPGQAGWPFNGNHYKVALLQADGNYHLERNVNGGDEGDLYQNYGGIALGLNTVPSADTYQGGRICPTFNVFSNISASGTNMTFDYSFPRSLYVDANYTGAIQDGSCDRPYRRVGDAYAAALNGDTIVVRAGDYLESPLNLNNPAKAVTINSHLGEATVR